MNNEYSIVTSSRKEDFGGIPKSYVHTSKIPQSRLFLFLLPIRLKPFR